MGWSIGYVNGRDVGYGVPAECDLPTCYKEIDRGLSFVCGAGMGSDEFGCGLFFCEEHMTYRKPHGADQWYNQCPRCYRYRRPYEPKPDIAKWVNHKLTHDSWGQWRAEHPDNVKQMRLVAGAVGQSPAHPKKQHIEEKKNG